MLEIVRYNEDEYDFPCLLVLGCFDGLHIGHADLLKKAKLQAKINGLDLGVMLFADGKGGKNLYSFEERVAFLEQYNAKFVLKIDFNEEFKSIKPFEFLGCLEDKLNVKAYMSGKDFRFGNGKKGKSSTLKTYAEDEENGVWYMPVKDVTINGEKVSTSTIKNLLENGKVGEAAGLLGRNYSVSGTVIKGADRGAKLLGFPTVNIEYPENRFEVKHGVYRVNCIVDGNVYAGIANFGGRPTFNEDHALLEAFLSGFEGSLYEKTVKIEFVDYIRDIVKFETPEALTSQLTLDLSVIGAEGELAAADSAHTEDAAPAVTETAVETASPVENVPNETEPEISAAAEEKDDIEQANAEFEQELEETVIIDEGELAAVSEEPEKLSSEDVFENSQEYVSDESAEVEELHAEPEADVETPAEELVTEPIELEEIRVEEVADEPVEAEEIAPEETENAADSEDGEVTGD